MKLLVFIKVWLSNIIFSMNNRAVNYVYPLDFQKAKKHRLANRIFKGNLQQNSEQCECCGKKVGQEIVQTTCNIQPHKFSFLGPGVPLFFLFLRLIIIMLLAMSILFMGFAIFSNVTSNNCGTSACSTDLFESLSIINKLSNATYMEIQSYLALVFVIICIFFFHYFRFKARLLQQQCDQIIDSPSDYAIILRRLPAEITELDIQEIIKEKRKELTPQELEKTRNLKVNRIILSYSLHQYNKINNQNIENYKLSVKQKRIKEFKPQKLPKPDKSSSIAIVVFQSQAAKKYFIHSPSLFQKIQLFFCSPCTPLSQIEVKGQKIGIQRAPEPDDIYWENSGITIKGAICRKLSTGIVSILILFAGGGAQYGLNSLSSSVTDSSTKSVLNILSSIIVTIFNAILMVVLSTLTTKQRNQTLTQFQTVLMVKLTLFQFLNAGVFVVLSQYAANYSTFTLTDGISSQITIIMMFNAITPNLSLFFLDYFQIINKVLLCCAQKQWLICTQKELNELSIGSSIDIPKKYAYILKTLWLTALFSPFIPVVVGFSMVGLIIFYFLEKFLYTKSYSIPNTVSSVTYQGAIELLQYFLITFSLGQLIIYFYFFNFQYDSIPHTWTITILATISLAVLNSALPMETINQYFFTIPTSTHSNLSYTQVQQKFEVTYEMTNPAFESKRQRKNIKDFIVMANKQDSKTAAIQMTNLFNATVNKKNQSMLTQKPLLSQYLQNKQQSHKSSPKSRQIEILISYNNQQKGRPKEQVKEQMQKNHNKPIQQKELPILQSKPIRPITNQIDKQVDKEMNKQVEKQMDKQVDKQIDKHIGDEINTSKDQPSNKIVEAQSKQFKDTNQKARKANHTFNIMSQPDIDPLGSLQKYTPPRFVLKWREEQQKLQAQKAKEMKQTQNILKQQPKLSKLPIQSNPNKARKASLDKTYENIFNDKVKPASQSIIEVPITSKYHLSNGKTNIYDQFVDPSHPTSLKTFKRASKSNTINKTKPNVKETPYLNKMNLSDPKPKEKFKYLVVKEINKNDEKDLQFDQTPWEGDDISTLAYQQRQQNSKKTSKKQLQLMEKAINDVFIDTFGNTSNVSSVGHQNHNEQIQTKFKLNQIQFKDQNKQKRATYNPISLAGGYKQYFNNKIQQKTQDPFTGYLNKKLVMTYLGTPFSNLQKKRQNSNQKVT